MVKKIFSFSKKPQDNQLRAIPFSEYDFENKHNPVAAEPLALQVANLLLAHPLDLDREVREEACVFLNHFMYFHPSKNFGTGNMRHFLNDKQDLSEISVAAQVKYCLEHGINSTYNVAVLVQVYSIVAHYLLNPANNVKLTSKLKVITAAYTQGNLADLITANIQG